ncbi:protein obstructor-E-like [Aricia agestis]|uniref:protein obstructor-E-like n=1 Tax=Aricia agestis TaxID=91739 RepID=UPI001C20695B|nr:protein obstructor-E-like [Aricia agestis]
MRQKQLMQTVECKACIVLTKLGNNFITREPNPRLPTQEPRSKPLDYAGVEKVKLSVIAPIILTFFKILGNGQSVPVASQAVTCENIRNAYLDQGLCDSYIECRNFKPTKRVCPDGLNYNPATKWPAYPCSYPNEAPCLGRQQSQIPQPTGDCQRQFGVFPSPKATSSECGRYIICSAGHAYDMYCPFGLAFNPATSSCDWPYNVPSCNVDEFYGITCPPGKIDESGNPIVVNLKFGDDCQYFFSCESGHGKLLKCDPGYAFNAASGRCENAEYVDCTVGISKVNPLNYKRQ